jgi:hypothetical protein
MAVTDIIYLQNHKQNNPKIQAVHGAEKFKILMQTSRLIENGGDRSHIFTLLAAVASCRFMRLNFDNRNIKIQTTVELLLRDILQK